jgi:hypothetical protein
MRSIHSNIEANSQSRDKNETLEERALTWTMHSAEIFKRASCVEGLREGQDGP